MGDEQPGDRYPLDAADMAGQLPPRARPNAGDRTIGVARLGPGQPLPPMSSGFDPAWTPAVARRLEAIGVDPELVQYHVELKIAAMAIGTRQRTVTVTINYTPCGVRDHAGQSTIPPQLPGTRAMTTSTPIDLLVDGGANIRDLPTDADIIGLLRLANADRPGQSWTFYIDTRERRAPSLTVGLDGASGFVTWWDGTRSIKPAHTPTGVLIDFWKGGHHFQQDEGALIPAEYIYGAVAEFIATRQRPHCVPWHRQAA